MARPHVVVMLVLAVSTVIAFPSMFADSVAAKQLAAEAAKRGDKPCPFAEHKKRQVPPPFDPIAQRISTTGANTFIPPGPTDNRGNCPGLNVLANHGYLPRSGYASLQQYVDAVNQGMSPQ